MAITVICIETRPEKYAIATEAILRSANAVKTEYKVLISTAPATTDSSIINYNIGYPIRDTLEYSYFMVSNLVRYFNTDHCLVVQHDGFVINPDAWTNDFIQYDYIGAPWPVHPFGYYKQHPNVSETNRIGNGGFSLRSYNLMRAVSKYYYDNIVRIQKQSNKDTIIYPEDAFICRYLEKHLKDMGFKFAPLEVANKFSVENEVYRGQLGFHGTQTILKSIEAGTIK